MSKFETYSFAISFVCVVFQFQHYFSVLLVLICHKGKKVLCKVKTDDEVELLLPFAVVNKKSSAMKPNVPLESTRTNQQHLG